MCTLEAERISKGRKKNIYHTKKHICHRVYCLRRRRKFSEVDVKEYENKSLFTLKIRIEIVKL